MAHNHVVVDTDVHYKIDGITRSVTNVNETKRELVQNDHNSERFTFEIPRYVDGHDFSECNSVQVHYATFDEFEEMKGSGVYNVDDLHVSSEDENTVLLSWLISGNATSTVGTLNFSIRFACVNDGIVEYAWNTTVFKGITILPALNNLEGVVEDYSDILSQLETDLKEFIVKKGLQSANGFFIKKNKDGQNVLYLTKDGEIYGEGVELPDDHTHAVDMLLDTEYAIDEKFNGKQVYTYTWCVGGVPYRDENTEKTYAVPVDIKRLVRFNAWAETTVGGVAGRDLAYSIPFVRGTASGFTAYVFASICRWGTDPWKLHVTHKNTPDNGEQLFCQVWYTKE